LAGQQYTHRMDLWCLWVYWTLCQQSWRTLRTLQASTWAV